MLGESKGRFVHLPTILKRPSVGSEANPASVISTESRSYYQAYDRNKRRLERDYSAVSNRYFDLFNGSQLNSGRFQMNPEIGVREAVGRPARMPGVGEANNAQPLYDQSPRQNQPYNPQQGQRTDRNGQPNVVYIYQPPPSTHNQNRRDRRNPQTAEPIRSYSDDHYLFSKELRKSFVAKVYLILSLLLAFTFVCCMISNLVPPVRLFFIKYWWISIIFMVLYFIINIALVCVTQLRRSFPINLVLLCSMCFCMTVPLCVVTAVYATKAVLLSLGTTVLITVSVSLLAKISPFDVTGCGMLVCLLALVFSVYAMITFIISIFIYSPLMHLIFGAIGTVLFTFFLFFDTQQILGGRRVELSAEEYILGVILLYCDIIMIFLMLLHVYGYSD